MTTLPLLVPTARTGGLWMNPREVIWSGELMADRVQVQIPVGGREEQVASGALVLIHTHTPNPSL